MNNWQSRKASIKRHQLPFLRQLADEMGYFSISDAVDYAIDAYKRYRALEQANVVIQPQKQSQSTPPILQPQKDLDDVFNGLDMED
ncbi:MAG: hypothetical protein F6K08_10015 [Okeania sp. SIO1H6]|uniref:hypothetical protein n=1 Tax=Okeania sp. SIO2B3 TaxID=2607784 RepID=UPI0013C1934E|nr:hypothetical protein [Okeania sp. SIO2B3]NET13163.1 hypothetical protein [Okeania sp. SIO1H6]NET46502.1 hypothetical protein [Okeania sp. SIO2B3]